MKNEASKAIEKYGNILPEEVVELLLSMQDTIAKNSKEIESLKEQLAEALLLRKLANKKKFEPSTEQLLLDIFPEIEAVDKYTQKPEEILVKPYSRKKRTREISSLPADAPVVDVDHTDGAASSYVDNDGIVYDRVEDRIVFKASVIPARAVVERHHYAQYKAREVSEAKTHVAYRCELDRSFAAPSLIADIAVSKFDDHIPLYRLEERFERLSLKITRQSMAKWMIQSYEMLIPMERLFKRWIFSSPLINKDETSCLILDLKNPGTGKPSRNSFVTATLGTRYDAQGRKLHTQVLYEVINGRSCDVLCSDFNNLKYSGYVMTDGLKQYKLDEKKHATCWVHARRGFVDAHKMDDKNIDVNNILENIAKLYEIEKRLRDMLLLGKISSDDFLSTRKDEALPIINDIISKCKTRIRKGVYSPNMPTGKAMQYILNYRNSLKIYLDCIECTPDNNIAERAIRPFAIGRKNWLFAQTVNGMDASVFFFSLVENAKLCSLPVQEYIEYVIERAPYCKSDCDWEKLMPWAVNADDIVNCYKPRYRAVPDPRRTEPYLLTGAGRN